MSHRGDSLRELRHKQSGGSRACFRLSREAEDALQLLCGVNRMTRLQVVERLLITSAAGSARLEVADPRIDALVKEFHVTREQAADVIERGLA